MAGAQAMVVVPLHGTGETLADEKETMEALFQNVVIASYSSDREAFETPFASVAKILLGLSCC